MSEELFDENKMIDSKAFTSLFTGIMSIILLLFTGIGIVIGFIGIIDGIKALSQDKSSEKKKRKMAISGIICSAIGVSIPVLLFALQLHK